MSTITHDGIRLSPSHGARPTAEARVSVNRLLNVVIVVLAVFGDGPVSLAQISGPPGIISPVPQTPMSAPGQFQTIRSSQYERPLDSHIQSMPRTNQELEVIHHRSQLIITRDKVRRIATSDPSVIEVVQFSETEFAVLGTGLGVTDMWLWFEGQEEPLMYEVTVIRDPALEEQRRLDYGRIERKLGLLYPNSKVYLIPLSRKIIVRGQARDTEEAARIMQVVRGEVIAQEGNLNGPLGDSYLANAGGTAGTGALDPLNNGIGNTLSSYIVDELTIPGEFQVMVRVRIAELNRSQLRRLGIDWQAIIEDALVPIGTLGTFAANPTFSLTGIFNNGSIQVAIDALASNGSAKILEDAQLVVLSGEPAAFLSGGEFAVPTIIGISGAQGQSTSFRGFGTSIIATPTVIDRDLIRLQIVPELSSVNNGNAVGGIPGVNVKRVQTRVELREGQTIVLGGLFSRREQAEVTRIPFLGEIPVVGWLLFNGKRASEDENELLIIVTPEIVRPMDADQVPPLPGFYVTHPDDIDFYKLNRTEGNPDLGHYQLLPYGNGQGYGQDVGFSVHNPAPTGHQLTNGRAGDPGMMGHGYNNGYMGHGQMMGPGQMQYAPAPTPAMQPIPAGPPTSYRGPVPQRANVQQTSGVTVSPRVQDYRGGR